MEKLFSQEDIARIKRDAEENLLDYWDVRVGTRNSTERTLITISKEKKLIIAHGNEDTGWEHLRNRHAPYTFKNYWKSNGEGLQNLDNPGKFHPRMMPIIDYVKIADVIFDESNRNIEKNKRPDLFDMFTGSYVFESEPVETYHLFVYKDTRIVHTLFPHRKKNNPKNKTDFAKGAVSVETKHQEGFVDLRVPYLNEHERPAFSVLVRKIWPIQTEFLLIAVHDTDGSDKEYFLLGTRRLEGLEQFDRQDMAGYQYADLVNYEKLIDEIHRTGVISSIDEVDKLVPSDFKAPDPEFEVSFEYHGRLGKADVKGMREVGGWHFIVTNIFVEGSELGVDVWPDQLVIEQMFILTIMDAESLVKGRERPPNETEWMEKDTERQSELVTAIGRAIDKLGQS
jgi:hypothetical protein